MQCETVRIDVNCVAGPGWSGSAEEWWRLSRSQRVPSSIAGFLQHIPLGSLLYMGSERAANRGLICIGH